MKEFIGKQTYTAEDVIKALDQLEDAKIAIKSTDPQFKTFILRLNDAVKNKFTADNLEAIAIKAYNLNIKDTLFWFSLDNTVKTSESTVSFQSLLVLFSILLRVKSYPQFFRYVSVLNEELLATTKEALPQFEVRHVIHASYVFASFDMMFPELIKKLKSDISASLKNPSSVDLSINELSTAALLLSTVLKDSDSEKKQLVKSLGQYISEQNLNEFCGGSAVEKKSEEDYREEKLTWQSIAFLMRVYYVGQNQNATLAKNLNETILYKAKNDPVDFESASIILSILSELGSQADKRVVESILETIHTQLVDEGAAMFSQYDGRNVSAFLKGIISLANNGYDTEIIGEFIEYFEGLVISDKVATKIEVEDYAELKKLFESANGIGGYQPKVFEHIQRRVEYINAQKTREQKNKA